MRLADREPTVTVRSETALQAFLLPILDTDEAIVAIERVKARAQKRLDRLKSLPPVGENPKFGMYALRLGLAQARATIEWADETRHTLRTK
ncbi:hypothetical protein ACIBEJ_40550 [Nonomuraea sp. NPDC050790]|uniref:hypothetical protein n=1 Tax=Nonomuraea sp. NPDC050790 TaxID=3364371 RepID=UPI0037B3CF0A